MIVGIYLSFAAIVFNEYSSLTIANRNRQVYCTKRQTTKTPQPLLIFFYGTTENATVFLDSTWYRKLPKDYIVCAPVSDIGVSHFEWHLVLTEEKDDLDLVDSLVTQLGNTIDRRQIHLMGFSAGGINVAHMAFLKPHYFASVSIFSGGFVIEQHYTISSKLPPFLIYSGGVDDSIGLVNFASAALRFTMEVLNHSPSQIYNCVHGEGHSFPKQAQLDAVNFITNYKHVNSTFKPQGKCVYKESHIKSKPSIEETSDAFIQSIVYLYVLINFI